MGCGYARSQVQRQSHQTCWAWALFRISIKLIFLFSVNSGVLPDPVWVATRHSRVLGHAQQIYLNDQHKWIFETRILLDNHSLFILA